MSTNIVVPALGESVSEATVAKWLKAAGDPVKRDEPLLELETDKVTLEVYASTAGKLAEIKAPAGTTVRSAPSWASSPKGPALAPPHRRQARPQHQPRARQSQPRLRLHPPPHPPPPHPQPRRRPRPTSSHPRFARSPRKPISM